LPSETIADSRDHEKALMEKTPSILFHDRFIATQAYERQLFQGSNFDKTLFDMICHWSRIGKDLRFGYSDAPNFTQEEMGSDPVMQKLIAFLLVISGAKRMLEIGTFIGHSAITFAHAMGSEGRVVTIEKSSDHAKVARENVARNGLQARITCLEGDAEEVVDTLARDESFDVIFLDAKKERYLDLFLKLLPLLSKNGIVLVDDCLFMGDVLNEKPTNPKGQGARDFLDHVAARTDFMGILIPLCSGLYAMTRKR
jgi:predicted O-methyltransferase YrrM